MPEALPPRRPALATVLAGGRAGRHKAEQHLLHVGPAEVRQRRSGRRYLEQVAQRPEALQGLGGAEHARELAAQPERRRVTDKLVVLVGPHVLGLHVLVAHVIAVPVTGP